jgi:hypothetical protein
MLSAVLLASALAQAAPLPASAGPPASAPASSPAAQPAAGAVHIPAGTELQIELVDTISSTTSHSGDKFGLRLAEPIIVNEQTLYAAGAAGQGEVIDAGRGGMSGSPGKLVASARYLELGGRQARVRGLTFMAVGTSHINAAQATMLLPYVGLASMFIKGGEITIPAGTRATVKLAQDVDLAPATTNDNLGK